MNFVIGLGIGVALGWVLFKRPQWVEAAVSKVKSWFANLKVWF